MKIKLITQKKETKSYLEKFVFFEFDNLLHLLFELFSNNDITDKNIDDTIYNQILSLGYTDVNQIPKNIKEELENTYFNLLDKFNKDFDEEKQTYLLMAKILKDKILVTIDNNLVEDIYKKIKLEKDSIITFTDINKIDTIKFTTL